MMHMASGKQPESADSTPALQDRPTPNLMSISPTADVLDSDVAGDILIRGGMVRLLAHIAIMGLSILSTVVLTRNLGVSRYGQYTTVLSLVAIVSAVTDVGMSSIGIREYAIKSGRERDDLMRDLLVLRLGLTLLGVVFAACATFALGYTGSWVAGALIASIGTIALVVQHTLSIPLATELRLGLLSVLDLSRHALSVLMILAIVALGGAALPLLCIPLVVNLLLIVPTLHFSAGRISGRLRLCPRAWGSLLRPTLAFSLGSAVGTVYMFAAQILTSMVSTHQESGIFAVSFRVFIVSAGVPGLLVATSLPLLSRRAREDSGRFAYSVSRILEVMLVGGVGAALVLNSGSQFIVSVIAGPTYGRSASVLSIQSYGIIASFIAAGCSYALLSLRRHREVFVANAAGLGVIIVSTLALASRYGAKGSAIATLCGEGVLAAALLAGLMWTSTSLRPKISTVGKVAIAGGCTVVSSSLLEMPAITRPVMSAVVYGMIVVLARALPPEMSGFRLIQQFRHPRGSEYR